MARTIRNAGSAPIYRETENLMLLCIEMVERTPNSVGIRQLSKRLIDTLLDGLTVIGLALSILKAGEAKCWSSRPVERLRL